MGWKRFHNFYALFDGGTACNYDVIMKAQIIQIGNSQGIRIPKMMLEETKLTGEVELEVHPDGLLIRSAQKPRGNWDAHLSLLPITTTIKHWTLAPRLGSKPRSGNGKTL